VILTAWNELPAVAGVEDRALAEKHLVEAACTLRPREVAGLGRQILAHLHPDGTLVGEAEQRRHRGFTLRPEADGSYTARGRLTRPAARCCWPTSPPARRRSPPVRPARTRATTPSGCTMR
jgi:hypothetical protein